jgi:capsid assembly protease
MHDLPHLASRVYGTPLLIARPKLEVILGVLGPRLAGEQLVAQSDSVSRGGGLRILESGIAVIPVLGTLVRRSSYLASASGLTAYHDIEAMAAEAFAHPQVQGVLLEIDSSGGEAGGVFDLAESLRTMSQDSGKPLWAVADEAALSAAYAVACAADRIFVPRTAEVGSIGVVAVHVDESQADAMAGRKFTFIHAGEHKVDGNPHEPLSPDMVTEVQADVDELYDQFVDLVAGLRRMDPGVVRATQARVCRGKDAVVAGLADGVGTFAQAHDGLLAHLDQRKKARGLRVGTITQKNSKESTMEEHMELPEPETPLALAAQEPAASSGPPDEGAIAAEVEARLRGRFTELTEIAAQAKRLGVDVDPGKALSDNVEPDVLRKQVLRQAAECSAAEDIVAVHPVADTGKSLVESPLVKAAKAVREGARQ